MEENMNQTTRSAVKYKRRHRLRFVFSILLLIFLLIVIVDSKIFAPATEIAAVQCKNQMNNSVNQITYDYISDDKFSADALSNISANDQVNMVSLNISAVNVMKTEMLIKLGKMLAELEGDTVSIPIGSLTGHSMLSGRGPNIHVRFLRFGVPVIEAEQEFYSAGINQTCHRIMLNINVKVTLVFHGKTEEVLFETKICVAENIIIGEVPHTYLDFK